MKDNRVLTILLGLLYVTALFVMGVSPPRVVYTAPDGTVINKTFAQALRETDVVMSSGTFTSGSTELKLVLRPGETAALAQFEELESLDASGSTNYDELMAWGQAHPEIALRYTVPLPDGQVLENTAERVDLTGLTGERLPDTLRMLAYVPNLRQLELGKRRCRRRSSTML